MKSSVFPLKALLLCVLCVLCGKIFSQDYVSDTLAVRAILDSNGLYTTSVRSVSDSSDGRIDSLSLIGGGSNANIPSPLNIIPPEIGQLNNLYSLGIGNNQLTSLPSEIGQLNNLYELLLHSNQLTSLPAEIGQLVKLEDLSLGFNQLTSLPAEIGQLNNLYRLWLTENPLTSLPAEIGQLVSLEKLHIQSCSQLTSLPPEIGQLINLISIYGENSQLTSLPAEIGNLKKLMYLEFENNQITSLPPEIGQCNNLYSLDLVNNQLTSLPSEIGQLNSLGWILVRINKLTTLPASIVNLTPLRGAFSYNKLNEQTLSDSIISWLDTYDPEWRIGQDVPIIYNPNFSHFELLIKIKNSSILFNLPKSGNTKLQIYNIKGRLLETLLDSYKQVGEYKVNWDIKRFGSGVYFLKLSINGSAVSRKVTVIQ